MLEKDDRGEMVMNIKKMYLANLNVTFGEEDEPLLRWLNEFVYPALNSGFKRKLGDKTKVMFEDVRIEKIGEEYVLRGIIIKDTILDIYNEYDEDEGLKEVNHHPKSAPYSAFMIFLKNHRMILVRNQKGSPNLMLFASTFSQALKEYRIKENNIRKETDLSLLPDYIVTVKGIASRTSITDLMEKVRKIKSVTFIMQPRNNENGGLYGLLDELDDKIRKKSQSKYAKLIVKNPESKEAISDMIASTEGLVSTEMEVEYYNEEYDEETKKLKKTGKIKDNEISQVMDINVKGELRDDFINIFKYCVNVPQLNVENKNNIIDYKAFVEKRMDKGE